MQLIILIAATIFFFNPLDGSTNILLKIQSPKFPIKVSNIFQFWNTYIQSLKISLKDSQVGI